MLFITFRDEMLCAIETRQYAVMIAFTKWTSCMYCKYEIVNEKNRLLEFVPHAARFVSYNRIKYA